MRRTVETAAQDQDDQRRDGPRPRTAEPRAGRTAELEYLQRSAGNSAVVRLVAATTAGPTTAGPATAGRATAGRATAGRATAGRATASHPSGTAHAMQADGSQGTEELAPQPIGFGPAEPDVSPAPVNEEGLIDGEWVSEAAATVFVNAGKAGSGIVNWTGGNGGTTPGIGSVTAVAPTIETRAAGDAGTAAAWVRAGTGTVNVRRHFFGVPTGANGTYYITAAAAARIDVHEQNHIAHSRIAHDAHLAPLETRVAARVGEANAVGGAAVPAAKAALEAELRWNDTLTAFRTADNGFNLPGGTVDTADAASAGWYHDLGPRTVGGVNYAHYVDV